MRFLLTLIKDIRYQMKYGFYLLYAFISAIYIALLFILPAEYKRTAASVLILSDPSMLGVFFIGGIWLLERSEGLLSLWGITPLLPIEYILSKALSLSLISTLSAVLIVLLAFQGSCHYFLLTAGVFTGSMVFTLSGLLVATYSRSVNHYMLIATMPAVLLTAPAILSAFGITCPVFEFFPGTALWRIVAYSLQPGDPRSPSWPWACLALWLGIALLFANKRVPAAMLSEGGEKR